jgi:hypothetical protein
MPRSKQSGAVGTCQMHVFFKKYRIKIIVFTEIYDSYQISTFNGVHKYRYKDTIYSNVKNT